MALSTHGEMSAESSMLDVLQESVLWGWDGAEEPEEPEAKSRSNLTESQGQEQCEKGHLRSRSQRELGELERSGG